MAVAQTICNTVLEQLNVFSLSGTQPDPFTAIRLRREIEKLEKVDSMAALLCSGILYSVEKDVQNAIETFEQILTYAPDDANMHHTYAHALAKFRMANAAHQHYLIAVAHGDECTRALIDLAETAQMIFRPSEFMDAFEKNAQRADVEYLQKNVDVLRAIRLNKLFIELQIAEDDANRLYCAAESIFIENDLLVKSGYFKRTGIYGGSQLTFYAAIAGNVEFISEVNLTFCDRVIDLDAGHILKDISFVFVPYSEQDDHNLDVSAEKKDFANVNN